MNLGETILRLRTGRSMSQEDLAAALNVSRQSVSKWETNASVPELDKLIKLSALFGVTLDELVTGEKEDSPPPEPTDPPPPAPPPQPEPRAVPAARRVVGWILLGLSAAVWLILLAVTQHILSILFALPFLSCGVICLTARRDAGLWCGWALLGCVDLYIQYAAGISWSMIVIRQVYDWEMYAQLATAWGMVLFTAALMFITIMRFRKRPVEWTSRKRRIFAAEAAALVVLIVLPYRLTGLLFVLGHIALIRVLSLLLGWVRLALFTALLTALAQGIWKRQKPYSQRN